MVRFIVECRHWLWNHHGHDSIEDFVSRAPSFGGQSQGRSDVQATNWLRVLEYVGRSCSIARMQPKQPTWLGWLRDNRKLATLALEQYPIDLIEWTW